jgi:hypothetical protein
VTIEEKIEEFRKDWDGDTGPGGDDVYILTEALKAAVNRLREITNTNRENDPNNYLADHLKWLAAQGLDEIEEILK